MRKKKQPEEAVEMQDAEDEQVVQNSPVYRKKASWYSPVYRSVSRAFFGKKPSKADVKDDAPQASAVEMFPEGP